MLEIALLLPGSTLPVSRSIVQSRSIHAFQIRKVWVAKTGLGTFN